MTITATHLSQTLSLTSSISVLAAGMFLAGFVGMLTLAHDIYKEVEPQ
jgi:hypothetical protein